MAKTPTVMILINFRSYTEKNVFFSPFFLSRPFFYYQWARFGFWVNKALCINCFFKRSASFLFVYVGFGNESLCFCWFCKRCTSFLYVYVGFVNQNTCFCFLCWFCKQSSLFPFVLLVL